jgi:DNA repair ATPase RecN
MTESRVEAIARSLVGERISSDTIKNISELVLHYY